MNFYVAKMPDLLLDLNKITMVILDWKGLEIKQFMYSNNADEFDSKEISSNTLYLLPKMTLWTLRLKILASLWSQGCENRL